MGTLGFVLNNCCLEQFLRRKVGGKDELLCFRREGVEGHEWGGAMYWERSCNGVGGEIEGTSRIDDDVPFML